MGLICKRGAVASGVFAFLLLAANSAAAIDSPCPDRDRVPDYNCNGEVQISVLGDSLVYGIGDTANNEQGGYVKRAQQKLQDIKFLNFGVSGQRTRELLKDVSDALVKSKKKDLKSALESSDLVVLDIGRNDRWLFGPPQKTYRNIKRIANVISAKTTNNVGYPPLVVTAVLMLPNRGSQGPWVSELNQYIIKGNRRAFPTDLRFDKVSKRLLSSDQIHPTSLGYTSLAKTFVSYLKRKVPRKMHQLRPDLNDNGIPDIFE